MMSDFTSQYISVGITYERLGLKFFIILYVIFLKVAESKLSIPLSNLIKLVTGLNESHYNAIFSKQAACPLKNNI